MIVRNLTAVVAALAVAGCSTSPFYMGQQPSTEFGRYVDQMPENIRRSITSVHVHAGDGAPALYVGGDYGDPGPTAGEGAAAGAASGAEYSGQMVVEDPRTLLIMPIVLPFAMIAGSIAGAIGAKIEQQVRSYRDGLTDDMLDESNPKLPNDLMAQDLRAFIERVDGISLVSPDEADAVLTISLTEFAIVIEGNDAEMTASAQVSLEGRDGKTLYARDYEYTDLDTLRNWSRNDNALWKQFTVNARRHIARLASESLFEIVATRHVLRPRGNDWQRRVTTANPLLSWDFVLLGGDEFDGTDIADHAPRFDLEVYDGTRLVYAAHGIEGTEHTPTEPLPNCKTLGWTVRPILSIEGRRRAGEWMRRASAAERAHGKQGASFSGRKREYWDGLAEIVTRCAQ
jgi:hypothetical protein